MKKKLFLLFSAGFLVTVVIAQPKKEDKEIKEKKYSQVVSAGVDLPFGEFSDSHSVGLGVNYSWSRHHYGLIKKKLLKPFGIIFSAGVDYYFGKKDSYGYRLEGYTLIHGYGGLLFNPCKKSFITLTSGPVAAIYGGNTKAGLGITLNGGYYVKETISVVPGLHFIKYTNAGPLWAISLRTGFCF